MTDVNKALLRVARSVGVDAIYDIPSASDWLAFVGALSDAFDEIDQNREQLERSLERSSSEMRQLADQLRKERDVLNAVLAALSHGVVHLDRAGRVRYANRAFVSMFNIENDTRGRSITELVILEDHTGAPIDAIDIVHRLEPGAIWRDEECTVRRGTTRFAASVVISPVFDLDGAAERLGGFVVSVADVSEHRKSAARVRAAEFEVASAEQARQAQASFLANMSHELRTPLNAIIGYSELVAEEAEDLGYTEILPDLEKIQRSGRHLVGLISDVLDMSKIQAGKLDLEFEELDLGNVARAAYEATYPLAVANGNAFEIVVDDPLPTVEVDSVRITQAFVNLIGNAGKFTEDGTITLAVYARGPNVIGEVRDTGIGIPKEKLKKLFSPFTQADSSTTRKFGGTGLGLAITRQVVDAMRGKVEVDSVEGEGSIFRIVLPAAGMSEVYTGKPIEPVDGPTRTIESLLVVDDDRATHALIRRHLAETNIVIHSSFSAEEGFKKAKEIEPELLFLDILLPGIDGWAMLEHWRSHSRLKDIPFYVISVVNDRPRAIREGARGFLNKPIEGDDILDAVTIRDES